jgi:altronate hydrolase
MIVIQSFIVMDSRDNCATALAPLTQGNIVDYNETKIPLHDDIPLAHKFAIAPIAQGDLVLKYGHIIGRAIQEIAIGEWIHVHNVQSVYMERVNNE